MATRSVVDFICSDRTVARVYRHWDGHPREAGADLLRFLDWESGLADSRANDPSMLAARYVVFLAGLFRDVDADPLNFLSVRIVPADELWGAEYAYRVENGEVTVARCRSGAAGVYQPLEVSV